VLDPAYLISLLSSEETTKSTVDFTVDLLSHYSWIATKFTEPVRLEVAVVLVPKVARSLGFADAGPRSEEDIVEEEEIVEVVVQDKE
jgi:hypothetical protein